MEPPVLLRAFTLGGLGAFLIILLVKLITVDHLNQWPIAGLTEEPSGLPCGQSAGRELDRPRQCCRNPVP